MTALSEWNDRLIRDFHRLMHLWKPLSDVVPELEKLRETPAEYLRRRAIRFSALFRIFQLALTSEGVRRSIPGLYYLIPWTAFVADAEPKVVSVGASVRLKPGSDEESVRGGALSNLLGDASRDTPPDADRFLFVLPHYGVDPIELAQLIVDIAPVMAAELEAARTRDTPCDQDDRNG